MRNNLHASINIFCFGVDTWNRSARIAAVHCDRRTSHAARASPDRCGERHYHPQRHRLIAFQQSIDGSKPHNKKCLLELISGPEWRDKKSSLRNCGSPASRSSTAQNLCARAARAPAAPVRRACSMRHDSALQATHPGGAAQSLEDLRALDMIGIYVSAHWCHLSFHTAFVLQIIRLHRCPPCREFTPKLAQLYNELAAAGKKFGVVFISGDRDEKSFQECGGRCVGII